MKKIKKFLFFSLIVMLFLNGCNANDTKSNNDMFQFKDSYVGDNSAVINIANQLPGAEDLNDIELQTNDEPYGIVFNYDWTESEQMYKESVIYNATFVFTLVQNVNWITFNSENFTYTITKENLQEWYGKSLSETENEEELRELIQANIDDENKVNTLFNSLR